MPEASVVDANPDVPPLLPVDDAAVVEEAAAAAASAEVDDSSRIGNRTRSRTASSTSTSSSGYLMLKVLDEKTSPSFRVDSSDAVCHDAVVPEEEDDGMGVEFECVELDRGLKSEVTKADGELVVELECDA